MTYVLSFAPNDLASTDWGDWSLNNEAGDVVTITDSTVLGEEDLSTGDKAGQVPSMSDDGESADDKKMTFSTTQGLHVRNIPRT